MLNVKSTRKTRIVTECKSYIGSVLIPVAQKIDDVTSFLKITLPNLSFRSFGVLLLIFLNSFALALCFFGKADAASSVKKVVPAGNTALYKVTPLPVTPTPLFIIKRTKVQGFPQFDPQQKELNTQTLYGLAVASGEVEIKD